jgi:polysaccharide export outer membrane protein
MNKFWQISKRAARAAMLVAMAGISAYAADKDKPSKNSDQSAPMLEAKNLPTDYIIGSEDVLAVNVWKEPEISKVLPVRPDGKISLPLIGDTEASGLTPKQLQANIEKNLEAYMSHPEVTVIVQEAKSQRFNIVGEVERPGSYTLGTPMTVLDAIAVAGGFKDFAKTSKVYVLRGNPDGSQKRLPFNYKKVIKGRHSEENIALQAHDTVVVP